jgi:hypothetical protein
MASCSRYLLTERAASGRFCTGTIVPEPFADKPNGRVAPGTISWDPQTLTLAFGLIQPPPTGGTAGVNPVANRDVIVEGSLMPDGSIEA